MDKPKCFGKYPSKQDPGRKCRACLFAGDCKTAKPKAAKPPKAKVEAKPSEGDE